MMRGQINLLLIFFLAIPLLCLNNISIAQSGNNSGDTLAKDTSGVFTDDPIAAMLDSLSRLKFYDKDSRPISTNKYHFSVDSIPTYSDSVYAARLAKLDAASPFDLVYNSAVRSYIELYAVKKRDMMERMLGMSQLYFPMIEEILDKKKIPMELKYLAIVESALNPSARSRAGAVGLWQFMYGTGKMQGLKISSYIDERSDPYKSTEAACDYLQFLYNMFGDWQMVLAAYNGGPGTVSKAIRRSGGKTTYWEVRPYLPRETQGYVPAFIAVNYVMAYAKENNLYPVTPRLTFADIDTVNIKQELSFRQIAKVLDMSVEEIQYLNPCYKIGTIPYSKDGCYTLCLPTEKVGSFITNEAQIYKYAKKDSLMKTLVVNQVVETHVVKRGETLGRIAHRYRCTVSDLKSWNHLRSPRLRVGQRLTVNIIVKHPASIMQTVKAKTVVADSTSVSKATMTPEISSETDDTDSTTSDNNKLKYYTVQKGDSLWSIAQSNGVTIEQIKQWNDIHNSLKILPGQKIKLLIQG